MTSEKADQSECVPKAQVEVALRLMEDFHGSALRRPWSDEANAYYHAIDAIEGALNEEFDPDARVDMKNRRRSQKAREEGYAEATLLNERFGTEEKNEHGGFIRNFLEVFR